MRRVPLVVVLMAATVLTAASVPAGYEKTKVAVVDFQLHGEGYETADMGKIVAEWLITALVRDGRFEVIERRLLEKILSEQQLGASGVLDESSASKLGLMLGAKVVISGAVMSLQGQIEVNARIIDVQTGSVIAAESVKTGSVGGLEELVSQMARAIIRDFPLEGYVVRRSERDVIIDLGRTSGLHPGMQFVVFKEGEVVKHPKTGEVLDVLLQETGRIEVVRVTDKTADAVVISEAAAGSIEYGQRIKSVSAGGAPAPRPPSSAGPDEAAAGRPGDKAAAARGWLGVQIQELTPELRESLALSVDSGALVSGVVAGDPADRAGLKAGDVVVEFDGRSVRSGRDLVSIVGNTPVGRRVAVRFVRDRTSLVREIELARRPDNKLEIADQAGLDGLGPAVKDAGNAAVGVRVRDLTKELSAQLGLDDSLGALVSAVREGSPAERAGIRRGDVIIEVNRLPVRSAAAFNKAVRSAKPGRNLLLLVRSGRGARYVVFWPKAGR